METLKPLDEICEPDTRHTIFGGFDPEGVKGEEGVSLQTQYAQMERLELPKSVPETVRSAYAVTRMLWVYGWFYWPFYTLALLHANTCLEMALHQRFLKDGLYDEEGDSSRKAKNRTLSWLIKRAVEMGWLEDEAFEHIRWWTRQTPPFENEGDESGHQTAPDPQRYAKTLASTIPSTRNAQAHPGHYSHGFPQVLPLQNARDIIVQLFM